MRGLTTFAAIAFFAVPLPAAADEITDALNAAIEAYEEGDISNALEEVAYATQMLNGLQAEGLTGFLPEPMAGWSREFVDNASAGMGFLGGGVVAEAEYQDGSGQRFSITLLADNPMVAQMGAMLSNSAIMSTMGTIVRINRENFLNADGDVSGMIGNRVLVQASGNPTDAIIAHLETMDFNALEDFGD